jgi:hypothetical protein
MQRLSIGEMLTDMAHAVYNLAFNEDVLATEAKIAEYQRLEQASIARNRALKVRMLVSGCLQSLMHKIDKGCNLCNVPLTAKSCASLLCCLSAV